MMASYFINAHKPWPILNSAPELLTASAERIRQLKPRWILPQHFDQADGDLHRRRFAKLYGLEDWENSPRPAEPSGRGLRAPQNE
jgi:hypothetical protein